MKMKMSFSFLWMLVFSINSYAQKSTHTIQKIELLNYTSAISCNLIGDTLKKSKIDSTQAVKKNTPHSPRLAILLSAMVPGAGQIYNKKYWKAPIIWAGVGTCGYFIRSNHLLYRDYKDALIQRNDTSIKTPDKYFEIYSTDQLFALQDQYRQNRDLFIIVTSLVYVLNIVDALVDAHLFTFDVSDDLSLNWQPYYHYSVNTRNTAGISLQFQFR